MHTNESAEMYLESILELKNERGAVRSIDIARKTGYSKPSVSRAVGLLKKSGMIEVDGGVNLETGRRLVEAGADVLVAGNAVFKAEDREAMIRELKRL